MMILLLLLKHNAWRKEYFEMCNEVFYNVARILVKPTAAWMTVWPTPHMAAYIGSMCRLLCLYTKAMAAEVMRPRERGTASPISRIITL